MTHSKPAMGFLFYKKRQKQKSYIYIKINKSMRLKVRKEYLDYSIFVKGKRIYFEDMGDKQREFWFKNGYEFIFDNEKKPVIKKEEKLEDDTNK